MQRRRDDRDAAEPGRGLERAGVRLLDRPNGRLLRQVPRLHHAPAVTDLGRRRGIDSDDQVHAAGPEPEMHRRRVEEHPAADVDVPDEARVGDGARAAPVDLDLQLDDPRAMPRDRDDGPGPEPDERGVGGVVARADRRHGPSMMPRRCTRSSVW
jgi:hypothetical protein